MLPLFGKQMWAARVLNKNYEKEILLVLRPRSFLPGVALALVAFGILPAFSSTLTMSYLQQVSDRYQQTVDVYTEADAAGNHFAARGELDSRQADLLSPMDEISTKSPCLGITCITATFDSHYFDASSIAWGGWYFLNGVLGPTDRVPSLNWGDRPNAGYDLTGATTLRFWARGAVGGEVVHFFAFGVGRTAVPFQPFADSSAKVELPQGGVVLNTMWSQYQIPLTGLDLRYVLGGFGWVANAVELGRVQPPITFYLDNIQYLKARPNDPRLMVSYETISSANSFDTVERNAAYVYDNSVALIGFLAVGDIAHAQAIADALVYAQGHDRFFADGRVRNAYQGGDISLPSGWLPNNLPNTVRMPGWYDTGRTTWLEDETQVSSNTGNIAWGALAFLGMWETTKDPKYLAAAQSLGNWALANTSEQRAGVAGSLGGFTGGFDGWENGAVSGAQAGCASGVIVNGQCKRLYKSTEHNIDLYSVFSRLYLADGAPKWATAARQAKHFFLSMWDSQEGKFWTGTGEDGATIFADVIPLDIQAWSLQALGTESGPYQRALDYVEGHHATSLGYGFKQNGNNSCGDNTWFEGTSQVAVSYLLKGDRNKWQSILDKVHSVQTSIGGIPATDGPCLNTGFNLNDGSPWEYFPRSHVGATGWLALAENGVNAYKGELYSPRLSTQVLRYGEVPVGTKTVPQTISFTNPGAAPLAIRGLTVTGPNAQEFGQSNTCGAMLSQGQTCTISIVFSPAVSGSRVASLILVETSDPAISPVTFTVALTGSGVTTSPTITWQSPGAITFGSALGPSQLNAVASVPGTFIYTPPAGTVPSVGNGQILSVLFTPINTSSLAAASASVSINVNAPTPAIAAANLIVTETVARDKETNLVVTVTLANNGSVAASDVVLTVAKVGAIAGTPLPQSLGTINSYGLAKTAVTFPAGAGLSGAITVMTFSGTYNGGSFNNTVRIVLP